jgi:hypothetical protein
MKKSKKIISIAAFALTALAALTMTGCSVVDGAINGIFGSPLTKAFLSSVEYLQDYSNALTIETIVTDVEEETTTLTNVKYIFSDTKIELKYAITKAGETTQSEHYFLYYKQVDGDYIPYIAREKTLDLGVWYEQVDFANNAALTISSIRTANIQSLLLTKPLSDYAKKIDKATYTVGPDEVLKCFEAARNNGEDLGYLFGDAISQGGASYALSNPLAANGSITFIIADERLAETNLLMSRYYYHYSKNKYVKITRESTTKITYGGEVTLPVITPPAA